ncbi:hypothetical protein GJ496_002885 [Pomphorhynchus laevis]|nr:hypothetical protein GJ496_002885 [Pomphorhynchus laevis]
MNPKLVLLGLSKPFLSNRSLLLAGQSIRRLSITAEHDPLKTKIAQMIPQKQEEIREFKRNYGSKVIEEITIDMVYAGMRDIKSLVTETSHLDPNEGIRYRGYTLKELEEVLVPPGHDNLKYMPEATFWLLLTGEIPTVEQVKWLSGELYKRSSIPDHIIDIINVFPKTLHPMAQFSAAVTAMHSESLFTKAYHEGMRRSEYWAYIYEDALNLIAKVNTIAAYIYCNNAGLPIRNDIMIDDWTSLFAQRIFEKNNDFVDYLRLYFFVHADHEGGNVSAHTCHLVNSALSDPYLSFAAALNGLAGPLHGLANQETVNFVSKLLFKYPNPTDKDIEDYLGQTLRNGQVIPGCGHAVLRVTDPRYTLLSSFGNKYLPHDKRFYISTKIMEIAPKVLTQAAKAKNPYPNVDAISGAVLWHYGFTNTEFYTVLFGISRSLGTMASLIWDRALNAPLERPKSLPTAMFKQLVGAK